MRFFLIAILFLLLSATSSIHAQCTAIAIDCPNDVTVTLDGGECTEVVHYVIGTSGTCPFQSLTQTDPSGLTSGDQFPIGITRQSWESLDSMGNVDTCSFLIIILEYPNPITSEACNNSINLSPDEDCEAFVSADMILEGGPYGCYENYVVTITTTSGDPVPNPITAAYIGQTLIATVTDPNGTMCWGYINYEDYLITPLVCGSTDINCRNNLEPSTNPADSISFPIPAGFVITPSFGVGPFVVEGYDNCGDISLSYYDEIVEIDCTNGGPYTRIIYRMWTALDGQGNTTTCVDTINVRIPAFSAGNIFPNRDGTQAPAILCSGNWDTNGDGIPQPEEIGDELNMNCDVWGEYTDYIHQLNCGLIIDRSWQVVNMCTGELVQFIQKIKLVDDEAPQITCPSQLIGSTNTYDCKSNYQVPPPMISDDCSSVTYTVTASAGIVINQGTAAYPHYVIKDLEIGTYTLTYTAVDGCGNEASCTTTLVIKDLNPPQITCESVYVVYLGTGQDHVDVNDLIVFSSDDCGISHAQLRRIIKGDCDGTNYDDLQWHNVETFCCEEAGQTIIIEVGIWDNYGNYSTCVSQVVVESNTAPSMTCPPDITVSCSFPIDINDLSIFGSVVTQAADVGNVVIDDREWVEYCKGQTYNGPRIWGQDGLVTSECEFDVREDVEVDTECGRSILENGMYLPAITRTFIVENAGGQINSCTQRIYIINCNPQSTDIIWPDDVVIDACVGGSTDPADTGEPVIGTSSCDEISTTYIDRDETPAGDTCRHIIRHWVVTSDCAVGGDSILGEYDQNIYIIKLDPIQLVDCPDTVRPQLILNATGNLIFNGDFELGNVGFTSEYGQFGGAPGGYLVDTFPSDYNSDHNGVDHTTGSGNMMIVDGSSNALEKAWCQELSVVEGVEYEISVWVNNLIRPPLSFVDPWLIFSITTYSDMVISTGVIPESPNEWIKFEATWIAPETRTIEFCFWSAIAQQIGNDFAVDDISFAGTEAFCELNPANGCEVLVDVPTPTIIDCDSMAILSWAIDFDHDPAIGFVSDLNGTGELPEYLQFGQHLIQWSASDMCGGKVTCETALVLEDCVPPLAICADIGIQVIQDTNGITILAEDIAGGSLDNCGDVTTQFLVCDGLNSNSEHQLYGLVDNKLLKIDHTTGAIKEEIIISGITGDLKSLIFIQNEQMFYSVLNNTTSPELVRINLAGQATSVGEIFVPGETVYLVEGTTYNESTDQLFVAASLNGPVSSDKSSESLIVVNRNNGQAVLITTLIPGLGQDDMDEIEIVGQELFVYDGDPNGLNYFSKLDLPFTSPTSQLIQIQTSPFRALRDLANIGSTIYTTSVDRSLIKINSADGILQDIGVTHASSDYNGREIDGLSFVGIEETNCILQDEITLSCEDLENKIDTLSYTIVVTDQSGLTDTCRGEIIIVDSNELCSPPRCDLIYAITSVTGEYYSINTATGDFTLIASTGITTGNNAVAVNDDLGIGYFGTLQNVHWVDLVDGTTGIVGAINVAGTTLSNAAASYRAGYLFLGPETDGIPQIVENIYRVKMSSDGKNFDSGLDNLTNGSSPFGNFGDFIVLDGSLGNERMLMSINDNVSVNNIFEYTVADNTFSLLHSIPSNSTSQITVDNVGNIWYFNNATRMLGIFDVVSGTVSNDVPVNVQIADMGRAWCPPSAISSTDNYPSSSDIQFARNIPNPFNFETEIEFSLTYAQDVNIYIYGIDGKLVDQVNLDGQAGINSWLMKKELANGTYLYQIVSENSMVTGKMVRQ